MTNGMTFGGWIFMALAWGFILSLVVFCFSKVLRTHSSNKNNL